MLFSLEVKADTGQEKNLITAVADANENFLALKRKSHSEIN